MITESISSLTESIDNELDDVCELPSLAVSPISGQISRRFSISRSSKLAVATSAVFRRASVATVSMVTTSKPLQRRGSQSFGAATGRRLSQSIPASPRIRRGSMNVMTKITKVAGLTVNKDKPENKNTVVQEDPPRISVTTDKLLAKLQTLAEESDLEEDENVEEMLQRSSPANLFGQM